MKLVGQYESPDKKFQQRFVGYDKNAVRTKVVLSKGTGETMTDAGDWHTSLILKVPDLESTLEKVKKYGGSVLNEATEIPDLSMAIAVVKDPDGHILELIQFK